MRGMLPPRTRKVLEKGPAKSCDGCGSLLTKGAHSDLCDRCQCRYHRNCLIYYMEGQDLQWDAARCRRCDEELRKVGLGEVVHFPTPKTLTLADAKASGSNLFTTEMIQENLMRATPVTLTMTQTGEQLPLEPVMMGAPPLPMVEPYVGGWGSRTSFAGWNTGSSQMPAPALGHTVASGAVSSSVGQPPAAPSRRPGFPTWMTGGDDELATAAASPTTPCQPMDGGGGVPQGTDPWASSDPWQRPPAPGPGGGGPPGGPGGGGPGGPGGGPDGGGVPGGEDDWPSWPRRGKGPPGPPGGPPYPDRGGGDGGGPPPAPPPSGGGSGWWNWGDDQGWSRWDWRSSGSNVLEQCLQKLTEVASAGQRSKDREAQEKDRERYRVKSKPKEITAKQAEAFLAQLMMFENEMREDRREGEDLFRAFMEATRDQRAGLYLQTLQTTDDGIAFNQRLQAQTTRAKKNTIWEAMYQWARGRIYLLMGGEAEGLERFFLQAWERITLPRAELSREKVEEWLVELMKYRHRMYEIGHYRASEGPARELRDLANRIPKDTMLRQWYAQQREPRTFDEFYHVIQGWCKTRSYAKTEANELQVLQADVEEDEGDVLEANNLNTSRMARQSLERARGRGGTSRGRGRGRGGQQPLKPSRCTVCGGTHRLKKCPNELAKKDHDFQKRLASDQPVPKCDYRDPQGQITCDGRGHLRSHHKQQILEAGVPRRPPPRSPQKKGWMPRGGGASNPGRDKPGSGPGGPQKGQRVSARDAELEEEEEGEAEEFED